MTYTAASLAWARRAADAPHATRDYQGALAWFARAFDARGVAPIEPAMPDWRIRQLAEDRADLMRREIDSITEPMGTHRAADWLRARVRDLGARPCAWAGCDDVPALPPPAATLAGMFERAQCPHWWRRQLRRAVVVERETQAMIAGEVCARRAQVYCTNDTVERRRERCASNAAMLAATEIEDAAGQVITLAEAAQASTSNKAIRRGELMTRIRGCEEWAEAAGMAGWFTTNTCPSRFHAQTMHAGANPKHDGSSPRAAQAWLRATWARCRAHLQREGIHWYGFRVAEPHHDGCPHWHMLLWVDPAQADQLGAVMRAHWLADEGDEAGAPEHRCKLKPLEKGGAAGYVAKYIAKNIDDAGAVGAEGHRDTDQCGQSDWIGTGKAQRVEAWASAWGIRQFQALGQPPVTVWRELRRVDPQHVRGAAADVRAAHEAVNRQGERRACWRGYMAAQGGPMLGRRYGIRIVRSDDTPAQGRYGEPMAPRIVGVAHASRPDEWIASGRREWRPRGAWAAADRCAAPVFAAWGWRLEVGAPSGATDDAGAGGADDRLPRTRVNNCTRGRRAGDLMSSGIVGVTRRSRTGGRLPPPESESRSHA